MANFQYSTLTFHAYQFHMYQSSPINHSMDQGSLMNTCNERERGIPSDFVSKSQIPPFSTQAGLDNEEEQQEETFER